MSRLLPLRPVHMAFEKVGVRLAIADIAPLHLVSEQTRKSAKYLQIAASVREIGLVEPPVVARDKSEKGKYLLLDGHLRLAALRDIGEDEVTCLISTDDEAFTYNKRVNRLVIVQEHRMIVEAIERGVSEERIARALNLDVKTIHLKVKLLHGICLEAAELLKDKPIATGAAWTLKRMAPLRQIEAANLMIAMNKYSTSYAKTLLAATPQDQLADRNRPKAIRGLTDEQTALIQRESENLQREFKLAEQSYGSDHLDLVLARGYLSSLLANRRVVRYLAQHQNEILREFQKITEADQTAA
jgi:ParB-like chromosome segregation protein Spo0J